METIKQKTNFIIAPGKLDVIMTRIFNAPRELVYKACTDPKHKAIWWRCKAHTNIFVQMDVRPGGIWRIIQKSEDGKEFAFHGEYLEVVPPEKIVNTFEFEGKPGHVITETTTFEEQGSKTKLTITSLFQTKKDRQDMINAGMEYGGTDSMELLDELLSTF